MFKLGDMFFDFVHVFTLFLEHFTESFQLLRLTLFHVLSSTSTSREQAYHILSCFFSLVERVAGSRAAGSSASDRSYHVSMLRFVMVGWIGCPFRREGMGTGLVLDGAGCHDGSDGDGARCAEQLCAQHWMD
jgi:hypothetical protein